MGETFVSVIVETFIDEIVDVSPMTGETFIDEIVDVSPMTGKTFMGEIGRCFSNN